MKTVKQIRREAKQLFRLCIVDGLLDATRARRVAQTIFKSKRRGSSALLDQFLYLVKLDRARHSAEIASAAALPDSLRVGIQADLERRYGPGISSSFVEDPSLIGGMRIKVGSDVFDGSVKAGLDALGKKF